MESEILEKIEKFSQVVLREANLQRDKILEEFDGELEAALDEFKEKTQQKAAETYKKEVDKINASNTRLITNAEVKARQSIHHHHDSLIQTFINEVLDELNNFRNAKEYLPWLQQDIMNCLAKNSTSNLTVYLDKGDEPLIQPLQNELHVPFMVSDHELLGGYEIYFHDKRIILNHSFKQRLEDARNQINFFVE